MSTVLLYLFFMRKVYFLKGHLKSSTAFLQCRERIGWGGAASMTRESTPARPGNGTIDSILTLIYCTTHVYTLYSTVHTGGCNSQGDLVRTRRKGKDDLIIVKRPHQLSMYLQWWAAITGSVLYELIQNTQFLLETALSLYMTYFCCSKSNSQLERNPCKTVLYTIFPVSHNTGANILCLMLSKASQKIHCNCERQFVSQLAEASVPLTELSSTLSCAQFAFGKV
jgi:hypothetical protein